MKKEENGQTGCTFKCGCDMGSIKVFSKHMSAFFMNGVGDVVNTVRVHEAPTAEVQAMCDKAEFLGHFTAKKSGVFLSAYDCDDSAVYGFKPGRWFVYLSKGCEFDILFQDAETHA